MMFSTVKGLIGKVCPSFMLKPAMTIARKGRGIRAAIKKNAVQLPDGALINDFYTSRLYGSDENLERTVSMKTIGEQIRFYRLQKNWTQEDLGRRTMISNSTISLYENNARPVPADVIIAICRALEVTPNTLLDYEKSGENKQKMLNEATTLISNLYDKYMR